MYTQLDRRTHNPLDLGSMNCKWQERCVSCLLSLVSCFCHCRRRRRCRCRFTFTHKLYSEK